MDQFIHDVDHKPNPLRVTVGSRDCTDPFPHLGRDDTPTAVMGCLMSLSSCSGPATEPAPIPFMAENIADVTDPPCDRRDGTASWRRRSAAQSQTRHHAAQSWRRRHATQRRVGVVFGQADEMIVVVEGPSAAGKSTCAAHLAPAASLVPEAVGLEPPAGSSRVIAEFWTDANATRWGAALRVEADTTVAVCDTDPFKLHYHFCLMRIGVVGLGQMRTDVRAAREAMSRQRLGIADLVLCEIPEPEVLEQRRRSDPTRSRRRFDLHRRLGGVRSSV
jgi:hypothetical protein